MKEEGDSMRMLSTAEEQLIMFMEIVDKQKEKMETLKRSAQKEQQLLDGLAEESNQLQKTVNDLDKVIEDLEQKLSEKDEQFKKLRAEYEARMAELEKERYRK